MAELADAGDSKSPALRGVRVRLPLPARFFTRLWVLGVLGLLGEWLSWLLVEAIGMFKVKVQ